MLKDTGSNVYTYELYDTEDYVSSTHLTYFALKYLYIFHDMRYNLERLK